MKAWIGLGSNIGNGPELLDSALDRLELSPDIKLLRRSQYYLTEPWGDAAQDNFTNAVAELETKLDPQALLKLLHGVETDLGRVRSRRRWGPRTLDLDLLTCDDIVLDLPELQLPHPRMHLRRFVLQPLLEIEPGFVIPGKGEAAGYLEVLDGQKVSILVR
jgi:2-amino-4-hydroxy-6-hydroxymethyldihydropteridine diphosphokinase